MSDDIKLEGVFDFSPDEELGPIWITPGLVTVLGETPAPDDEDVVTLRLMKDLTFGTGGHPSTRLAIEKLLDHARLDAVPGPFLELGESSGLLAIIAAATGTAETYHATDSVCAAFLGENNGRLNGFTIRAEAPIQALHHEDRFGFYSTIATQVGGEPGTLAYIDLVYYALKPGGCLIWAGHEAKEHQSIKASLSEFFEPVEIDDLIGWPVIVAKKIKTP
jgi:ribosomal protein L11 methylase PrmA